MWTYDRDEFGWWIVSGKTRLGPWPLKATARHNAETTPEPKPEPRAKPKADEGEPTP